MLMCMTTINQVLFTMSACQRDLAKSCLLFFISELTHWKTIVLNYIVKVTSTECEYCTCILRDQSILIVLSGLCNRVTLKSL